ncbi:hypothetical protein NDU88_005937 [Pleurodeles waltl]|uniref:Uncharacterized protein n=1 Tax=Pleurodeles waltl TaxID=8319 RepID=A0AAV7UKQ0_PLEWA|nr:hypothetical protein NDU88_005937 [Pleurodeles waltl]
MCRTRNAYRRLGSVVPSLSMEVKCGPLAEHDGEIASHYCSQDPGKPELFFKDTLVSCVALLHPSLCAPLGVAVALGTIGSLCYSGTRCELQILVDGIIIPEHHSTTVAQTPW